MGRLRPAGNDRRRQFERYIVKSITERIAATNRQVVKHIHYLRCRSRRRRDDGKRKRTAGSRRWPRPVRDAIPGPHRIAEMVAGVVGGGRGEGVGVGGAGMVIEPL